MVVFIAEFERCLFKFYYMLSYTVKKFDYCDTLIVYFASCVVEYYFYGCHYGQIEHACNISQYNYCSLVFLVSKST